MYQVLLCYSGMCIEYRIPYLQSVDWLALNLGLAWQLLLQDSEVVVQE